VSFFNSKMQLQNFQVFNVCKLCSLSGSNLKPNYLTDTLKKIGKHICRDGNNKMLPHNNIFENELHNLYK